jgi:hypothetical protein
MLTCTSSIFTQSSHLPEPPQSIIPSLVVVVSAALCTSARVPKLSAGTAYQFRVRAVNHVGPGIWSQSTPEVITDVGCEYCIISA